MRARRIGLVTLVTLVVTIAGASAFVAPADAASTAYPVTRWNVTHGATQTGGQITWYNRTVSFTGALKAYSGCRYVEFNGYDGNHEFRGQQASGLACGNGQTISIGHSLTYDAPGGITYLSVELWSYSTETGRTYLSSDICARNGCF